MRARESRAKRGETGGADDGGGCREGVGRGAVGRDDVRGGTRRERQTRAGIDHVRVTHAINLDELHRWAGRREGRVGQRCRARNERRVGPDRCRNLDAPSSPARRRVADDQIAAGFDERRANPFGPQHLERGMQDVSFGDAAEVEPHAGDRQADRGTVGVKLDASPSDERAGPIDRRAVGQSAIGAGIAPERHDGRDRRVERAVGLASDRERSRHDSEEIEGHDDRRRRASRDDVDGAVGPVVAHLAVQRGDAREGGSRRANGRGFVRRMQDDPHGHAHVDLRVFKPLGSGMNDNRAGDREQAAQDWLAHRHGVRLPKIAAVAAACALGAAVLVAATPQAPAYRETIAGTTVAFEMVPVPGGIVTVSGERQNVAPFLVGRTEVTWDMYDVFALGLDTPAAQPPGADAVARPSNPYGAPDHGWGHAGYPVISVTRAAAEAFAKWLSQKTGRVYRLPTEAEWTHLATLAAGPEGLSAERRDLVAWHRDNASARTHPVAAKSADRLGLFDLFGNATEWVTTSDGSLVVRGGSFRDGPDSVGVASRAEQDEAWTERDPQLPKSRWWLSDGPFVGFRLVGTRIP